MKTPTQQQLNDPAWWPETAQYYCPANDWFVSYTPDRMAYYWERRGPDYGYVDLREYERTAEVVVRPAKPQGTEWVDGLPPVGWEGEYTKPSGFVGKKCVWRWCVVVAHDCGGALVRTDKGRYHLLTVPEYEFRSTATQAERERDELVKTVGLHLAGDPQEIADAIIAAGWRKGE